ncbi:L-threonylcarbamoyladenylate synthase [Archaeoglobus sp.]
MTKIYRIDPKSPNEAVLREVADMIKEGKLVAYPTETVYGLGTNALDENAVKRLFEVKGRSRKPISVVVSDLDHVERIAEPNEVAMKLMEKFFPGPITVIVKKKDTIPSIVTAGTDKIGIRMPDYKIPLKLAEFSGVPVTSTSANVSGKPSPTKPEHVMEDFTGKIDAILDAGETPLKIESTVIDTTTKPPRVLRVGALPLDEMKKVVGDVEVLDYKAYKPKAKVVAVFKGDVEEVASRFEGRVCIIKDVKDLMDVLRRCKDCDVIVFECVNLSEAVKARIESIADVIYD